MKNVHLKLLKIQERIKVTKNRVNEFGGYKYRSAEDINEALKPIAHELNCVAYASDEVVQKGHHFYVKTTITLFDIESGESIVVSSEAREDEEKKKMDGSQLTGSATSYARKYAYGGLLGLDDENDPDHTNKHGTDEIQKISATQTKIIASVYKDENLAKLLAKKDVKSLDQMTYEMADEIIRKLKEIEKEKQVNHT